MIGYRFSVSCSLFVIAGRRRAGLVAGIPRRRPGTRHG